MIGPLDPPSKVIVMLLHWLGSGIGLGVGTGVGTGVGIGVAVGSGREVPEPEHPKNMIKHIKFIYLNKFNSPQSC